MKTAWLALSALIAFAWVSPALAQSAAQADVDPQSGFRLPLPKRAELDDIGQRMYDRLSDPSGGTIAGLRGPGGITLYDSKLAEYNNALNQYLRREAGLGGHVREVAILTTAREFDSQFEWAAHEREALKEGVPQATIDAIKERKSLDAVPEADAIIITLGHEMFTAKKVGAATFARALKQFGPRGVLDIVALMGNYAGTASLLTAFDMQLPPGQKPLLPMP
jgi:4-carboxymuconolactone decarboxylase